MPGSSPTRKWIMSAVAAACLLAATAPPSGGDSFLAEPLAAAAPFESSLPAIARASWYGDDGVDLTVDLPRVGFTSINTSVGEFVRLECAGTEVGGLPGQPGLPVVRRLFCAPPGAAIVLNVSGDEVGMPVLSAPVAPFQPPLVMPPEPDQGNGSHDDAFASHTVAQAPFHFDRSAYAVDEFLPGDRAVVKPLGIMGGLHLYQLEVRPIAYNAVQRRLALWPRLEIELRFHGAKTGFEGARFRSPAMSVVLNPPRNPLGSPRDPANFLIVTAQVFAGSAPLTQFVNAKTAEGYNVSVYAVAPGTYNTAIRAYIQSLWGTPNAPDYLLIVGDAYGSSPIAAPDEVPVFLGGGSFGLPTDLPYACMDPGDDWFPDIIQARWSARTVEELQNLVDKTLYVEAGNYTDSSYSERAMFIAHSDPLAGAEALHDQMINMYMQPNRIQARKLYYNQGARTEHVAEAFNDGAFLAVYYGHSGVQQWNAPQFDFTDIEALVNENLYPFIMSYGCNAAAFWKPLYEPVLLEKFTRVPLKGACAGYGPTVGLLYEWSTWADVYKYMMSTFYTDNIRELGPACQAAMAKFVAAYGPEAPVSRDYSEGFGLLGDPTMLLPTPPPPNYLVLTPPDYLNSAPLNELVSWKQGRGFNVTTYLVPVGTTNTALKGYIQSLWGTENSPDYVCIVGDTTGTTSAANSIPHFFGLGSKQATTDWPYVCFDAGDDWYPEIPIGRLPVRTIAQLQAVVNKTIAVEAGTYPDPNFVTRGAFLANPDTYNTAEPTHDWVINNYFVPNGYAGIRIYAAQGGDTQDVTTAVNNGVLWTVYMGHSSSSGWWDPAFDSTNVNALTNLGKYGLVMGWSCNTSHYDYDECFGETWVRAANKGAAAYISASNYIYWGSAEAWAPSGVHERSIFAAFFEDNLWEIGPAWLSGMYRFLSEYGGWDGDPTHQPPLNQDVCRNFFEEFVILGDPSLQLPQPKNFTLASDPESILVCTPPTDHVSYTIQVGTQGGFYERVNLQATGLPQGATIEFSINNEMPPFNSVMTVSDLLGAASGSCPILVTGISTTKQRSINVTLGISNSLPDVPVLTGPASGATDVLRQPTLTWQAAAYALDYDVEIARDSGFGNVVYTSTVLGTSHTVEVLLDSSTQYYWHVRAGNGCGDSVFSSPFDFATLAQADYFTEEFTGSSDAFDLDYFTLIFVPDGSASFYDMCGFLAASLPTDPAGGTTLTLADDAYTSVNPGHTALFYGQAYNSFYVNANGNITFLSGDGAYQELLTQHFNLRRIAAVFDDLNPGAGGTISWKAVSDRVAVSWQNVPEYGTSNLNTFQIELLDNGEIHITWLRVDVADAITGLSQGTGIPPGYVEMDLSAAGSCVMYGACCMGQTCSVISEAECLVGGGVYRGDETTCFPDPCIDYQDACVIISEVVDATLSGGCPKFIEITNTGTTDFVFVEGGIIVQLDGDTDAMVDVDLSGLVIPTGEAIVVNSLQNGTCTGSYEAAYGVSADVETLVRFGDGDDRYILTDKADGSHLLDIYGEFGIDGTGRLWEYTDSYAYRLPEYNAGRGQNFAADQWSFGGLGGLEGPDPELLIATYTTPSTHQFNEPCTGQYALGDMNCDGDLNGQDVELFTIALVNPGAYTGCDLQLADVNDDQFINTDDCQPFVSLLLGQ